MTAAGFADVAGASVVALSIQVPLRGAWTAAVTVDGEPARPGGIVALNVAGVAWKGRAWRWAPYHGTVRALLVGGLGWGKTVPAKFYGHGARVSTIAGDMAREVDERVTVATDADMRPTFTRAAGPASRTLHEMVPEWHVQADGVTRLGPRAGGRVAAPFEIVDHDGSTGRYVIATEKPCEWLPGRVFPGPDGRDRTITGLLVHLRDGTVRAEVFVS